MSASGVVAAPQPSEPLSAPAAGRVTPVRVAVLLPSGMPQQGVQVVATALANAARLAERDLNMPRLQLAVYDTLGTPEGAAAAAGNAIASGAELIVGPLFAHSVRAVAPIAAAAGVNVVAFSTDSTVAGGNVFLLSIPPEIEVDRVVEFAAHQGITRFGAFVPQDPYGDRVAAALSQSAGRWGGAMTASSSYPRDTQGMLEPARAFTGFGAGGPAWDAALFADDALSMRSVGSLLPYYNVDPTRVMLLGTGRWNDPNIFSEPLVQGGYFAAPDPDVRRVFIDRYFRAHGAEPPPLASLAYDAVTLAGALVSTGEETPFTISALTDANGFSGVDGIFRFGSDGLADRGLAILRIGPGQFEVVDPAPSSFAGPTS